MQARMRDTAGNDGVTENVAVDEGLRGGLLYAAADKIPEGIGHFADSYLGNFPAVPLPANRDQVCCGNRFINFWLL